MPQIDIVAMPISEKLKLMEALWDSMSAPAGPGLESPAWHAEVLEQRLRRLASGEDTATPWKDAKERIRSRIQPH